MSEQRQTEQARAILSEARRSAQLRTEPRTGPPPDYKAVNAASARQKAALTRAVRSGSADRVVIAVHRAVNEWNKTPFHGVWPDDWGRWQVALDDALGWPRKINTVIRIRLEDLVGV